MMPAGVIDVSRLPNLVTGSRGSLWWGMAMLLAIESAVFGTLIASYFYLRLNEPEWPPPGVSPPDLLLPTVNSLILFASSIPMYIADSSIQKGDQRKLRIGVVVATLMGLVFLVLKAIEYAGVEYRWDDHAYGSIVWMIIGFHSAHVGSVVLKGVVVGILAYRGYFNGERHLGVQINGMYWHFVVAVWLPLYIVLYWAPRLM